MHNVYHLTRSFAVQRARRLLTTFIS